MTTKNKENKALTHGGPFERTFGNTASTRILDFLLVHKHTDYSKQDISQYSDVSMKHALITIAKLEKLELIKHTRNVGRSQMYQYNTENKTVQLLSRFAIDICSIESREECQNWQGMKEVINPREELLVSVPA